MKNIPLSKPTYDESTKKALCDVLDSGWVGYGSKVIEFQTKFAEYVGAEYAVATNSATSALDICLKVYGITEGELITTPMTFVADASVGEFNGLDVVFCDIDPETLCLDPQSLKITPETRAIIVVDSHGRLADIAGIRAVLKDLDREDIIIIEDAAHAMYTPGVGTGDLTVYSFQAVKTLPIFDGGMITCKSKEMADQLKALTWLGIEKSTFDRVGTKGYTWEYDITHSGIKGYMTDVQAVIGLGQLPRLEGMNAKRREIQERYNAAFKDYEWFKEPVFSHTVQYYSPQFSDRDGLCTYLTEKGIAVSVHFKPLHELTYWKKSKRYPLPNTDAVWVNLLSLPVHESMTEEDIEYVINSVKEFYA